MATPAPPPPSSTPTQEDYLKTIWLLIQRKGYARVSDIAEQLGLSHASVSRMIRRLHEDALTTYEPYRGLNLTPLGQRRGRMLVERQRILGAWLVAMGLSEAGEELRRTVEGIEHHFGPEPLAAVDRLVRFIAREPLWWQTYRDWAVADGEGAGRRRRRRRADEETLEGVRGADQKDPDHDEDV